MPDCVVFADRRNRPRTKIDLPPAHSGAILAYSRENRSLITIAGQLMICYRSTGERAWQVRLSRKEVPNVIDRGAAESGRTRPLLYPEHILFGNGMQFDWTNGRLQRSTSSIPQKPRGCSQILGSTYYLTGRRARHHRQSRNRKPAKRHRRANRLHQQPHSRLRHHHGPVLCPGLLLQLRTPHLFRASPYLALGKSIELSP